MRQYALIHRAILDDPSWRCLTRSQQNLYLLLLLKLSTNLCGVVDWRPKKLAVNASDMTVESSWRRNSISYETRTPMKC